MNDTEIDKAIREYECVLPASVYIDVCRSRQVDHVRRDGDQYEIWSRTGGHWRVTVKPD